MWIFVWSRWKTDVSIKKSSLSMNVALGKSYWQKCTEQKMLNAQSKYRWGFN